MVHLPVVAYGQGAGAERASRAAARMVFVGVDFRDTVEQEELHAAELLFALKALGERAGVQVRHPRHLEPHGQPVPLLDFRHAVEVQRNLRPVRPLQRIGPGPRRARPGAGGKGRARPHPHVVGGVRLQQQHRQARGRGVHRLGPQLAAPSNVHMVAEDRRVVAQRRGPIHDQRPGLARRYRHRRRPGRARPRRLVPQADKDRLAAGEHRRQATSPTVCLRGSLSLPAMPVSSVFGGTFGNCSLIRIHQEIAQREFI